MVEAFVTVLFDLVGKHLGRFLIRALSFGCFSPTDKDDWWVGFVGVVAFVFALGLVFYFLNM